MKSFSVHSIPWCPRQQTHQAQMIVIYDCEKSEINVCEKWREASEQARATGGRWDDQPGRLSLQMDGVRVIVEGCVLGSRISVQRKCNKVRETSLHSLNSVSKKLVGLLVLRCQSVQYESSPLRSLATCCWPPPPHCPPRWRTRPCCCQTRPWCSECRWRPWMWRGAHKSCPALCGSLGEGWLVMMLLHNDCYTHRIVWGISGLQRTDPRFWQHNILWPQILHMRCHLKGPPHSWSSALAHVRQQPHSSRV